MADTLIWGLLPSDMQSKTCLMLSWVYSLMSWAQVGEL